MVKFLLIMAILLGSPLTFADNIPDESLPVDVLRALCDERITLADEYFEHGQTGKEEVYLSLSQWALETCTVFSKKSGGWVGIESFISTGKNLCKQSSEHKSLRRHGRCIIKLTQTISAITM